MKRLRTSTLKMSDHLRPISEKRWHWHQFVYYPYRQKVDSHDASCIQVQRKQTAVQTQHLNLTTKILSMSTIKLRMAVVTLNPFVPQKTINGENERNLDFSKSLIRFSPTKNHPYIELSLAYYIISVDKAPLKFCFEWPYI